MLLLLILSLVCLFVGLLLLAARSFNRSEPAVIIRRSICISAGVKEEQ